MPDPTASLDALQFSRRVIALLEQGAFSSTYKFALLVALIELCQEREALNGRLETLTTRDITERMVELYWPQAKSWGHRGDTSSTRPLRQNAGAEIAVLTAFAQLTAGDPCRSLGRARADHPVAYAKLIRSVESTVRREPLPKLQVLGRSSDPQEFIYEYTKGADSIRFCPGAAWALASAGDLLRPAIEHHWALKVAKLNGLPEMRLHEHLFGADRKSLEPIRSDLLRLQSNECFYCGARVTKGHVDHFLPWASQHDDRIENLVLSCEKCNLSKSDTLASASHLERWLRRFSPDTQPALLAIAQERKWDSGPAGVLGVARTLYGNVAAGLPLWEAPGVASPADPRKLANLLTSLAGARPALR